MKRIRSGRFAFGVIHRCAFIHTGDRCDGLAVPAYDRIRMVRVSNRWVTSRSSSGDRTASSGSRQRVSVVVKHVNPKEDHHRRQNAEGHAADGKRTTALFSPPDLDEGDNAQHYPDDPDRRA